MKMPWKYIVIVEKRSSRKSRKSRKSGKNNSTYEIPFTMEGDAIEEQQFVEYILGYPSRIERRRAYRLLPSLVKTQLVAPPSENWSA